MGTFSGLVEGFNGRREEEYKRNYETDATRRTQEGKIYDYLLQSNDPQMRALALSGLFESAQPGTRKKSLGGFLGEVQGGQIYPQILARMREEIPDESSAPTPAPPPATGSAAMSTNQTTRPGSAPISMPPTMAAPTDNSMGMPEAPPEGPVAPPNLGPQAGAGVPAAPPPNPYTRRGTGIPTAHEIMFSNEMAKQEAALVGLRSARNPEEIRLISGMHGAPTPLDTTQNGPVMADPRDPHTPIPTIRHRDGSVTTTDGTPVEVLGLVGYVKPARTSPMQSTVNDTPEMRKQYGIPPNEPNTTGYWKVRPHEDGTFEHLATEFVPPPAYAGTTTLPDPSNPQVPVRVALLRGGGKPVVLGDVPEAVKSQSQLDAEALLATVTETIKSTTNSSLLKTSPSPAAVDQIVSNLAKTKGLPYKSYAELEQAAKGAQPITPRQRTTGGTLAERVRARVLQNRGGGAATPAPLPSTPPVPPPPAGP
jgi:hypothetical protein